MLYYASMEPLHAILFGIIEGITEFLPISSTGHLILFSHLLGYGDNAFVKTFEIAIQLGAILAVVVLYPKRFLRDNATLIRIMIAFFPTALLGFIAYPFIKTYLLGNITIVLWSLLIGGVFLILFERLTPPHKTTPLATLSYPRVALIGLIQTISFIPGVSRAAATAIGGMSVGLSREEAVEFSFLLAVPTMGAATALDLLKNYQHFGSAEITPLLLGGISAFVVALGAISILVRYVRTHTFTAFGVYRILLALCIFALIV